ncbi:hypothetical protein ACS0TY_015021 [Phlomoides rotata]
MKACYDCGVAVMLLLELNAVDRDTKSSFLGMVDEMLTSNVLNSHQPRRSSVVAMLNVFTRQQLVGDSYLRRMILQRHTIQKEK